MARYSRSRARGRRNLGRLAAALAGIFLVGAPTRLVAQKTYAFGIAGGAAVPMGQFGDAESSGYTGTIALAIGSGEVPIGVRFDGIYNHFSRKDMLTPQVAAGTSSARISGGLVNLIFAFPGATAKAYMIAGVGYYNTKAGVTGAKADNNIGFNGGLGATFGLGRFATFVETRYHSISRSASRGGVVQFVPVTIGLLF